MAKTKRNQTADQAKTKPGSKTDELSEGSLDKATGGVENPTTIGSATGGAGAGKIKFNEF